MANAAGRLRRPDSAGKPSRFLISGAASGIGRQLVTDLALDARVLATDLDADALLATADAAGWPKDRVQCQALDVRRSDDWRTATDWAVTAWGGLDVVLNVAGVLRPAEIHQVEDRDIDLQIDVNTKGVILGTRAAARLMRQQGFGHIINIASLASMAPVPGLSLYSASKYAVRGFSIAVAEELRHHGVAVSVVCPDAVDTPMLDLQAEDPRAAMTFTAPRILTPQDISRLIRRRVLTQRPLLVSIPRRRAALARLADLFPGVVRWLAPHLLRLGRKRQAQRQIDRL